MLMWEGPAHCVWCRAGHVVLSCIRKQAGKAMGASQ